VAAVKRGLSLPRVTLVLFAAAFAHFATAVVFGRSVTNALEALAEDTAMLAAVVSMAARIRSKTRRQAKNAQS
jgi:hypothetical protein